MRKIRITLLVVLALLVFTNVVSADMEMSKFFVARLSGANEVPARETGAIGKAGFVVSPDGSSIQYTLLVSNINNAFAAHIHCGAAGVNGPVGVTLFRGTAGSGPAEGVLASGVITAPDANNACGWTTLWDVLAAIMSGDTYVNVHTNDNVPPTNTGPGDFASGEIRGQIIEVTK